MRRIVFGLLLAALVYWSWTAYRGAPAAASGDKVPRADLAAMLANAGPGEGDGVGAKEAAGKGAEGAADAQAAAATAAAGAPAPAAAVDAELERAFQALVQAVEAGNAEAKDQAMRVLARPDLPEAQRARLRTVLGLDPAKLDDIGAVLQRLGENNAFLHSGDGRELGRRALELLRGLDDEAAVQAGTALLERCMRGSIERKDVQAIAFVDEAYKLYRVRADRVLCDPANLTRARSYTVVAGDSLAGIAGRFRREGIAIDETSLAILNRIHNANAIRPGQRIRVPMDPIRGVVEKRSFLMAIYVGDRILRLYWVGLGLDGKTPVAEFTISEKLKDPDWDSPNGRIPFGSPDNILGKYFLKFDHPSYVGFGAHGTPMPETIGTMSSAGCVRMLDDDIAELFRLLPRKAKVEVRDSH